MPFLQFPLMLGLCTLILTTGLVAREDGWTNEFSYPKAFIENNGQFKLRKPCNEDKEVLYAFDEGQTRIFFTRSGVSFSFTQRKPYKEEEGEHYEKEKFESAEEWLEEERKEKKGIIKVDDVSFYWQGANSNVEVIADEQAKGYFSYSFYEKDELQHVNFIKGYKKLTYKNLYPNIDVTYEFHPEGGIKYSIIVHPGGDISKVKMVYSDNLGISKGHDILIPTQFGNIIDHAPVTFYADNHQGLIHSEFQKKNKIISFSLGGYDKNKTIVVDPWTQTPTFTAPAGAWEVEVDAAGNVYAIGGGTPLRLVKYNSLGVFQWSYNTPYDTNSGDWLGALATDNAGNSYVTNGSIAALTKVNTAGSVLYSVNGGAFDEYWQIAFNCDQTKLLIGGTRLPPFPPVGSPFPSAMIFDVDPTNGSVNSSVFVGVARTGLLGTPSEVRAITSSYNARYYYLTHDTLGAYDQTLGAVCPNPEPELEINHGYAFAYKCEDYRPSNGNGPISAIVADANFVYTQNGSVVDKRDLNTGAILASANIPGGITTTDAFGFNKAGNSGIAMDDCGNVYLGSSDRVVKFDGNLNILSQTNVSYRVSDVEVSPSGEVVICGSTGTTSSSSRTGYVQSVAMNPCAPVALICCDAHICPAGPLCTTDASITLTPNTPGGTWSGPGITNAVTGTFDPSVAGTGTHTIVYTLPCGADSTEIVVNTCGIIDACLESNGDITASGGDGGPYDWDEGTLTQDCSGCILSVCGFPPGCEVITIAWTNFATGVMTATPPAGADTVRITDASSNELIIYDITALPPCPACDATITPAGPFCQNDSAVTLTAAQPGGTWSGTGITDANNGVFDPATAGAGTWDIIYNLSCGNADTTTITVNAADDATFYYSPATYCPTDSNPVPTIVGTSGGTFSISGAGSVNNSTGVVDLASTGLGTFTITYSTNGACPDTFTFDITINSSFDATIMPVGPFCANDPQVLLMAVDSGGTWSGTGITDAMGGIFDPSVAGAGSWVVTYAISGSCGDTDSTTITVNPADDASFNYTSNTYCLTDPDPMPIVAGTPSGTFTIDSGGTINSTTGVIDLGATGTGTFTVTYSTGGPCPDTNAVNISIDSSFDASINPAGPFCEGDSAINLTAAGQGGTWSGTGIIDAANGTFDPATAGAGTWTITYMISGSCGDTSTTSITVNASDDASFNYAPAAFCLIDPDPLPNITGTSGGTFTISGGGSINANSGQVDIAATGAGNFTVTYTTNGSCPDSSTFDIAISSAFDATISPVGPFCDNDPVVTLTAADAGGTWSGTGIVDTVAGTFDPSVAGTGTFQIFYSIPGSCGDTDTVDIAVNPSPSIIVAGDVLLCEGDTVTLTATTSETPLWSTGDTTASIVVSPADSTIYVAQATNGCGTVSDTAVVNVTPAPVASVVPDSTSLSLGTSIQLNASGGNIYLWFPPEGLSCTACSDPLAAPLTTTVYCVDVSIGSCADTACLLIEVLAEEGFVMPSAFSPNGDGINDYFNVLGDAGEVLSIELRIFNRWGEQVYYSDDVGLITTTPGSSHGWDGTYKDEPVDIGTFAYYAKLEMVGGESKILKGSVTVVR